jgi:hypothetical protein
MNQDQVKAVLLDTIPCEKEFSVVFSGKSSALVNGLYKPASAEILIHNRNFESDNQLIYTALHEYAHHVHAQRKGGIVGGRAHTNEFWGIFQEVLLAAERKGHYENVFETSEEFRTLTERIKASCIHENGRLMLEFGHLMMEAQKLCEQHKTRFEDYIDRILGLPRTTAGAAVRAVSYGIDPAIGWDGMKMAAGIKDEARRDEAVEALRSGLSPAAVKARFTSPEMPDDPSERLHREKERLEKMIENLSAKLAEIEQRLHDIA